MLRVDALTNWFSELTETAYHKYLWYVLRHKYYVLVECWKEGLYWQGLVHDASKFLPSEFIPYAKHFHGPSRDMSYNKGKAGYCKPTSTGDNEFDYSWFLHIKRNSHHWQHWCCPQVGGEAISFQMPDKFIHEMICDWRGAGKAQNNPTSTQEWYLANCEGMVLHPITQSKIEHFLGLVNLVVGVSTEDGEAGERVAVSIHGSLVPDDTSSFVHVSFVVAEGWKVKKGQLVTLAQKNMVRPLLPIDAKIHSRLMNQVRRVLRITYNGGELS